MSNPSTSTTPTSATSQQDNNTDSLTANDWASVLIKQIKDEMNQQSKSLRQKITTLHQHLTTQPIDKQSVTSQYYGLQVLIKCHLKMLDSKNQTTGHQIEEFWTPQYTQKWNELETLFNRLILSNNDGTTTTTVSKQSKVDWKPPHHLQRNQSYHLREEWILYHSFL